MMAGGCAAVNTTAAASIAAQHAPATDRVTTARCILFARVLFADGIISPAGDRR